MIYKYALPMGIAGCSVVEVPMVKGSNILDVQFQGGHLVLWAEVDPDCAEQVVRTFRAIGTGWDFDPFQGRYLKTLQEGLFVWHIYEVGP